VAGERGGSWRPSRCVAPEVALPERTPARAARQADEKDPTSRTAVLLAFSSAAKDGRSCRLRFGSWCCGWRGRIRAGAIDGSAASFGSSASAPRRRASAGRLPRPGWSRRRAVRGRVDASSCKRRLRASSPAISSPSRACSCGATTPCSSSSTAVATSGSLAARPIPPAPGSRSRHAISASTSLPALRVRPRSCGRDLEPAPGHRGNRSAVRAAETS
jgi:hypothetical protein